MSMMKQPPAPKIPTMPSGNEIAVYSNYMAAQKAVDALSDAGFEVQTVAIVGHDLHTVERVTGRLTYPRVAFAGFASGAWFGLFVGLLMSLFNVGGSEAAGGGQFGAILPAMLIGGGFGLLFSVISYALQRGRRDFTSQSQIVAARYVLLCDPTTAGKGRAILAEKGLAGDLVAQRPTPVVTRPVDPSVPPAYGVRSNAPVSPQTTDEPKTVGDSEPNTAAPTVNQNSNSNSGPTAVAPPTPERPLTYGEALDAQRKATRDAALSAQTPQRAALPDGVAPSSVTAASTSEVNRHAVSPDLHAAVGAQDVPMVDQVAAPAVVMPISNASSATESKHGRVSGVELEESGNIPSSATTNEPASEFAPPTQPALTRRQLRNPDNPFSPPIDED